MFQPLIDKILEHPSYGPAMAQAVETKSLLVLNYHNHGPDTAYCVSICKKTLPLLNLGSMDPKDIGPSGLEELVHIRGFGQTEDQCVPLSGGFGLALQEHYALNSAPTIYLNGHPLGSDDSVEST